MTEPNFISDLNKTTLSQEEMARRQGNRFFYRTLIFTGLGAVLVTLAVVLAFWFYPIDQVIAFFDHLSRVLVYWRLFLFIVLIGGWPVWANIYRRWAYLNDAQFQQLLDLRGRLAFWLVLMELLLTQNILGSFIHVL